jgi:hypothetical protein
VLTVALAPADAAGALDAAAGSPRHHTLRGLYGALILSAGMIVAVGKFSRRRHAGPDPDQPRPGSLPRPESLISLNGLRAAGEFTDEETYRGELSANEAVPATTLNPCCASPLRTSTSALRRDQHG